jgi:hypothetical protein
VCVIAPAYLNGHEYLAAERSGLPIQPPGPPSAHRSWRHKSSTACCCCCCGVIDWPHVA